MQIHNTTRRQHVITEVLDAPGTHHRSCGGYRHSAPLRHRRRGGRTERPLGRCRAVRPSIADGFIAEPRGDRVREADRVPRLLRPDRQPTPVEAQAGLHHRARSHCVFRTSGRRPGQAIPGHLRPAVLLGSRGRYGARLGESQRFQEAPLRHISGPVVPHSLPPPPRRHGEHKQNPLPSSALTNRFVHPGEREGRFRAHQTPSLARPAEQAAPPKGCPPVPDAPLSSRLVRDGPWAWPQGGVKPGCRAGIAPRACDS